MTFEYTDGGNFMYTWKHMATLKKHSIWIVPLLLALGIAFLTPGLDLTVTRHFYQNGHFTGTPTFNFLYIWGPLFADVVVASALIGWIASYLSQRARKWRPHALYLVLVLGIGSGLIIHGVFKDHWGRPRPKQVLEFGGKQPFRAIYQPNFFSQPEPSKGFPCGHCSTGFYFFAFYFLGQRLKKQWLSFLGMALALLLGGLLSYMRIAQGGHFLSDTLISGIIMWLSAFALDRLLFGPADARTD